MKTRPFPASAQPRHRGLPEGECRSPILEKWEPRMDPVWRAFLALDAAAIAAG